MQLKSPSDAPSTSPACHFCVSQRYRKSGTASGWCDFEVVRPSENLEYLLAGPTLCSRSNTSSDNSSQCQSYTAYTCDSAVQILVVEDSAAVAPALKALEDSMEDPVLAIDLEWRPDRRRWESNRVAMIQLASSTVAVLIRTCKLGFRLGPALSKSLRDPDIVFVGFSWETNDESKFQQTFRRGRRIMTKFIDLLDVALLLGYRGYGLVALSERVLQLPLTKSKQASILYTLPD